MRKREYLSPSQVLMFEKDPEGYYLNYLAENKVAKPPQTKPMAVGSSFDVQVKAALHRRFGRGYAPLEGLPKEEWEPNSVTIRNLLAKQIENPLYFDELTVVGEKLLRAYQVSGAFSNLCIEIADGGIDTLQLEFDGSGELWGIPFVFKPDLLFRFGEAGIPVVYDWKVNGYYSTSNTSPTQGYRRCADGWTGQHSRDNGAAHKGFIPVPFGKMLVLNGNTELYQQGGPCDDWTVQLAIYGLGYWGADAIPMVIGIEQLACKTIVSENGAAERLPRVASHRWLLSKSLANTVKERVERMWEAINSDWVFRHMTKEDSLVRQEQLERQAQLGDIAYLYR